MTDGVKPIEFEITEDGKIVDLTDETHSIYNQIIRGDIEGVKIGSGTHKRLANVPFRITSKTTGESHIIVTDANGQFSTSSDWVSHKQNTNAGKTSEDGIWFGTSTPDDSKGALLYDTYTIEELRCDSNKGMTLIPAFDVVVSKNKVVVDLGTLTDEYEPEITIHTTATDKVTGEKSIVAGKSVTIVDTVTLDGLTKGTKYQLKGWQMVKSENAQLLIDGEPVESDYTFTAKKSETSRIHVPARISAEKAEEIKKIALTIYKILGCSCFARIDMFLTPAGKIYFNEVNTIPGFTSHSRYPNMLKASGLSFDEVIEHLLNMEN